MARKRHDFGPAAELQIKAMMVRGASAQAIADALEASGVQGASMRTIARRMNEMRPGVNAELARARATAKTARVQSPPPVPVEEPPSIPVEKRDMPPPDDDDKATPKDRQIDELMSRSLAWRRIQHAIATALAGYPTAAAAVVRALRGVQL